MSGHRGGRGAYYKEKYGGKRQHGHQPDGDAGAAPGSGHGPTVADDDAARPAHQAAAQRMGSDAHLRQVLMRLDGKGYRAYRDIEGAWSFQQGFTLIVDHTQADPFASPSRCRVQVPPAVARVPEDLLTTRGRQVALRDWLARRFAAAAGTASAASRQQPGAWHGAKGGDVAVDAPGQHVLERTAVVLLPGGGVEGRFTVGLPAQGRSIMGQWAARILADDLPRLVQHALLFHPEDAGTAYEHVRCVEDTQALRAALPSLGLVSFVGDGSILPRASGASDAPMPPSAAPVAFAAPPELAVKVQLPNRGLVRGMGVRCGITLIVGGGFHGKSTLLKAIEAGVYDKVVGDGRELVATVADAAKVRAEDGRRVEGVDVSPFISNLPYGRDTRCFRTDDASGSTSQAAAIQEALELGCSCLLMDEDTCATNLMTRDEAMAALIPGNKEPITPLRQRIAALRAQGVSSVIVMGGSGAYLGVADTVIALECFAALDVTAAAHAIARGSDAGGSGTTTSSMRGSAMAEPVAAYGPPAHRVPTMVYPTLQEGGRPVRGQARGLHAVQYGSQDVALGALEQLVDRSQTRAVADALAWLHTRAGRGASLSELLAALEAALEAQGLDALAPRLLLGSYARPRMLEVGGAINRLRTLRVEQR